MERTLGKYKLDKMLGSGSFGAIWLAEDSWLEKKLALKIPHNQGQDMRKILAEPKLLASLDHPNIVRLITVDQVGNKLFLVMEYIDGPDLRTALEKNPYPMNKMLDICRQILSALEYSHARNVVHRDLKPTNILLTSSGVVKVTDFGTAVHGVAEGGKEGMAGTINYMAREQIIGKPVAASDVYSMGVMLYEMVTGRLPFEDAVWKALVTKILKETPLAPREINNRIPAQLEKIILKAIDRDLGKRYKSAGEMKEALEALPPEVVNAQVRTADFDDGSEAATIDLSQGEETEAEKKPAATSIASLWTQGYGYKLDTVWSQRGRDDGQFINPVDISVDSSGRVYVVDSLRCDLQVFDKEMKFLYKVGGYGRAGAVQDEPTFLQPAALSLDTNGHLVVLDQRSCFFYSLTLEGKIKSRFGGHFAGGAGRSESGIKGFEAPRDITTDTRGHIFVADTGNNRIGVFSNLCLPETKFGAKGNRKGDFNGPVSLVVNGNNQLVVLDAGNFEVKTFSVWGEFKHSFGKRGKGETEFDRPVHVNVDAGNNIFVCDGPKVKVFEPNGKPVCSFTHDAEHRFSAYGGLAIDDTGVVWVTAPREAAVMRFKLEKSGE